VIKDLEMKDFVSHRDTKLGFGRGITVFVGHNGSGKSSVIDAITYALFGEHTRKANKNLVRRGSQGQAMVRLCFTLNSKEFQVTRSLAPSGSAAFSQLELLSERGKAVNKKLVGGERRQYGESTSAEVAKVLGLDYDRLRVAAVVQQGELARIVEAQPKEFKELINGLIGIDRLDLAFSTMKDVISGFRDRLRGEIGYSDEDVQRVQAQVEQGSKKLAEEKRLAFEYAEEKTRLEEMLRRLDGEIEAMEPLKDKAAEVQAKEKRLIRHVAEKRGQVAAEIARLERVAREAKSALAVLQGKEENNTRLQMVKDEIDETQKQIEASESQAGKLRGLLECSGRIRITDGKCPVCNSDVTRINEMFDGDHIRKELKKADDDRARLQVERVSLKKEEARLAEEGKRIAQADVFLAGNSIRSPEDVVRIEGDLAPKKEIISRLPKEVVKVDDPLALAIDDASRSFAEEIASLRNQVRNFSMARYAAAKDERWKTLQKLQDASARLGAHQKAADDLAAAIDSDRKALARLEQASEFVCLLERIRSLVYNRDGTVGMSLRSWALQTVSKKASEYASLFNIGISRVELQEEKRDIDITCYGKNGEVDMGSLSGGEKVAVALAIRLGIAYMMGSSKLDFVILDEPTTHLDEERRKALVRIVSDAFREGAGPLAQLVIITHDADIFEDSEVDAVFRFSMTSNGSQVAKE
jgi:DNA repair protein SbcC/Rad50